MKLPRLYAVTDENVIPNNRLVEGVQEVLQAGVRLLQVRFKKTPYPEQIKLGRKLRELTRKYDTIFIVNDSPELAVELDADGVHLGADDPDIAAARKLLGPAAIIGVSCYENIELVKRWGHEEVAYIGLSSPYVSTTKKKEVVSLSDFKALVGAAQVPVYAIGGVTSKRVGEMMQAGCYGGCYVRKGQDASLGYSENAPEGYGGCYGCYGGCYGVAVISAIFGAENPGQAVKDFLAELERFRQR